jgi:ribosomal protein S27AE
VKKSSTTWLIQHQCPQCGAPVTLREDDRLFSCEYCRVRLCIHTDDFFRYYIPPEKDIEEEVYYVPYWRFKGLYYSCPPFEVSRKVLDSSFLASGHTFFPTNLGFRAQVLPLRFISPEVKGRFIPTNVLFHEVVQLAENLSEVRSKMTIARKVFHKAFIGETVSVIYSPVYIKNKAIYDAVLKRPLATFTASIEDTLKTAEEKVDWNVKFLSTLCPECGWDMIGENESVSLVCGNCVSVWEMVKDSLKRVDVNISLSKEDELFYVPFWRIKVKSNGIDLHTYADFARAVNLPRTVIKEWKKQGMFFWLPAFKSSPDLFIRLAKLLTIAQPQIDDTKSRIWVRRNSISPITLRATDVADGLKTILANVSSSRKQLYPLLPDIELKAISSSLILLPFRQTGSDLVEANLNLRIPVNTFHHHKEN